MSLTYISPTAPCSNGDVRLSDGISNGQGRVEFCHNQIWGTICDSGWGIEDANVVCGQLGYVRGTKLEPMMSAHVPLNMPEI